MDMDLNNRLTEDETLEQAYDIFPIFCIGRHLPTCIVTQYVPSSDGIILLDRFYISTTLQHCL